jgi:site-specific recombinase XerD
MAEYLDEMELKGNQTFIPNVWVITNLLNELEEKTSIRCNAHSFRRTFATESVRNGMNLFHVQSLLGHSSLTMTRIYAEQVNSKDAIKAYKAVVR